MELFLIRHAHAIDGEGLRDEDRPLSAEGRRQARRVGEALGKEGVRFGRLVTSPLVRAVETAELLAVALGFDEGLEVQLALCPDATWKRLRQLLEEHDPALPLALVGHQPSIGTFLSRLLHTSDLVMEKGAVARLRFTEVERPAELVWTLSPKRLQPSPTW